ncbi:alanine--tRNA ligase, cytoplasmic [Ixodes scapularis]|nr:alanine--tRNA ligase, cytoplasmic [Ixodes scapularis]
MIPAARRLGLTWQRWRSIRLCSSEAHRKLSGRKVRQLFLDYFTKDHGHQFIPSSSVVPSSDKSILFTNAGMNQFKSVFLGAMDANSPFENLKRAANYQKCIRVGGKHNDLEDVGKDLNHHTFFEMLGNWSFGDYFKKEACAMAWELLTEVYRLPKERLYVTYFAGDKEAGLLPDEECQQAWLELGLPPTHVLPFGMKDNFWEMGNMGPCGPSTEIHIDLAEGGGPLKPATLRVNAGSGDLVELWNLVFIQFNRDAGGNLSSLPNKHVDTGMGLERLTAVLQNVKSNYDTDLFSPLLSALQKSARVAPYRGLVGPDASVDVAYRIVVDHARMFTVAISDGVLPEHFDAGNKLRRVIRKASHAAIKQLKCDQGVLASLADSVYTVLGEFYPNLDLELVKNIVNLEEDRYLWQMSKAEAALRDAKPSKEISGKLAWDMYVQYGLQKELIADMAADRGLSVNWVEFSELFKEFQEKSEAGKARSAVEAEGLTREIMQLRKAGFAPTDTDGIYNYTSCDGNYSFPNIWTLVKAIFRNGKEVDTVNLGEDCLIVTSSTNFYFESGGQVSDKGTITTKDGEFCVQSVKSQGGFVFHRGVVSRGAVSKDDAAEMCIDKQHRTQCMLHHTATHCLNMALRAVLGSTEQRSSLVDSRHLRFDFLSKKGLTTDQVQRVQDCCNAMIRENHDVQKVILPKSEALELPQLVTVANEEYPTSVSVITIGKNDNIVSRELCCGTHVSSLSDLGEFVLTSHRSVGSMVRSVCAVAGPLAVDVNSRDQHVAEQIQLLAQEIAALMKLPPDDYVSMASCREKLHEIRRFIADNTVSLLLQRTAEEKLEKLKRQIDSIIRKYNHTFGEQRVLDELNTAVKQWEGEPFQVVCLRQCTDGTLVTKLARKLGQHKPSFIAVRTSPERLQVDCYVPEEFLSDTFQACTWAAVAERYGFSYSYSSSNHSEPEMYYKVIICCEDNSMEELESVAVEFAKAQLSGSVASRT